MGSCSDNSWLDIWPVNLFFIFLFFFFFLASTFHIEKQNKKKRPLLEIFSTITILHSVQGLSAIKCTNPGEKGGGLVSFESGSTGFAEGARGTLSIELTLIVLH